MTRRELPINELILLYIAREAPGIRRAQLGDAALATLSMDYFEMAAALDALVRAQLLHLATRRDERAKDARARDVERCDLTAEGRLVLDALNNQIPASTRRFITQYLEKNALKRQTEDHITATVEETPDGMYRLTCRNTAGTEDRFLLQTVFPSKTLAQDAAAMWRRRNDAILTAILQALTDGEDKKSDA